MRNSAFRVDFAISRWLKWSFSALLLSCSLIMFAQPVPQLPQDSNKDQNAPNTKPIHDKMSNKDVTEKLQKGLDNKNPAYKGSNIQAAVDDQSVTLSGSVTSDMQREWALQLARAYAGSRKVVDRLTVSQ